MKTKTQSEPSILARVFGNSSFMKVLDVLMDYPNHEYTKKELAEVSGISRTTLYNIWDKFEEMGIIKETRKIGNTQLFKLNLESKIVRRIREFEKKLAKSGEIRLAKA